MTIIIIMIIKKSKERLITAASNSTNNVRTNRTTAKTRNGKKNNCTDISSDKLAKFLKRRTRHGDTKETLREKLRNKIENVGYVVTKTKRLLTL